ncbi:MAG: LacI family DNA-binding transcriptional regulator [Victivallales bacterium]|nr:LacI family DNA-binding transcriptional regulator [Victivallales bacterium]
MMARKPEKISLTKIAAKLGVSVSAVSRVVNNRTGVSEDTRREVLKVLRRHNFKVKYPEQRARRIALVTEHALFSGYVATLIAGVFSYCRDVGLVVNIIVYEKHNSESLLSILRDQQCSGVILPSPIWLMSQLPELSASGLPVMLINRVADDEMRGVGSLIFDYYSGARMATEHLLSMKHRNICCYQLSSPHDCNNIQKNSTMQGYLDAMAGAEITVPEYYYNQGFLSMDELHLQLGNRVFKTIHIARPEISAFIFPDDDIASGAICAAVQCGLKVPEDISIISLSGYFAGRFCNPPLTAISHHIDEAGRLAAEAIDVFLKSNGKTQLPKRMLQVSMEIRDSSGINSNTNL